MDLRDGIDIFNQGNYSDTEMYYLEILLMSMSCFYTSDPETLEHFT